MRRNRFRAVLVAGAITLLAATSGAEVLPPDVALQARVVVVLQPGYDAATFMADHPQYVGEAIGGGRAVLIRAGDAAGAAQLRDALRVNDHVLAAQVDGVVSYTRTAFTPNDPYFPPNVPTVGDPGQWYLSNPITPGRDAGVQAAWSQDVIGTGVRVGIIDDGFDTTHPDLVGNYAPAGSFDFGQSDADPSPVLATDNHGTAMAGLIAATGGDGVGVTGIAPGAQWAGLRVNFAAPTVAQFVDATLHESSGASQSIDIKLHAYAQTSRYVAAAAEEAALATSTAAGTIHVFPAGNNRLGLASDANTLDLQNSPDAITVAAMGSDGKFATYSSFGANVFVTAPSNSATAGTLAMLTTDRAGTAGFNPASDTFADQNYTLEVGGTSSAAAIVAGALAMAKQVNPNLDTRLAKHLLAKTSVVVDASDSSTTSDSGWETNAAGFTFNPNYGFGLLDASALVQAARDFESVTPLQTETVTVSPNSAIPDGTSVNRQIFAMTSTTPLEEVLVTLNITHTNRGQLEVELASPEGTRRRVLAPNVTDTGDHINWTFSSNEYWGEDPSGLWNLYVFDRQSGTAGTLNSYSVTLRMGELVEAIPEPATAGVFIVGSIIMLCRRSRPSQLAS